MAEFALVVPIFLLLLFGIIDGGRAIFAQQLPLPGGARGRQVGLG